MNGFELHKIKHVSPSSINSWIYSKEQWVRQYLFGQKTPKNAAMQRGLCVEDAIVAVLSGDLDEPAAITKALQVFNMGLLFSNDKNIDIERDNIPLMARQGIGALSIYGKPDIPPDTSRHKQHKINILCRTENWTLPVVGYIDLFYPNHKFIIDIKTTNKLPEDMPAAHRRQAAIYSHAMPGHDVVFHYLSAEDTVAHQVDGVPEIMVGIKEILIEQEAFLSSCGDKEVLLKQIQEMKNERCKIPQATPPDGVCGPGDQASAIIRG